MFIRKVKIHNFKCYRDFEITLEEGLNIVVGDNCYNAFYLML